MNRSLDFSIEEILRQAWDKISTNSVLCFHCLERGAINVMLIVTDDVKRGAPLDGSRVVAVGICAVCELLTGQEDLREAAKRTMGTGGGA